MNIAHLDEINGKGFRIFFQAFSLLHQVIAELVVMLQTPKRLIGY